MDTERTKKRLKNEDSKTSVNGDVFLKIGIDSKEKLLPTNEINKIVNVGDVFNNERNECKFYRIIGTINPLVSNPLFNLSNLSILNKYTWSRFNSNEFLKTTYLNSINDNLKEKDGWFGFFDPNISNAGLCNFIDMEPKRERFSFLPDTNPFNSTLGQQPVKNWELIITYPKDVDKTHNLVNNGLLIIEVLPSDISTRQMTAIGLACRHNLSIGDIVRISGTNGYNGDHEVISLGLSNGDYKDYYFVIDVPNNGSINNSSRMKKIMNGIESEYYFRKFKKIKTKTSLVIEPDDYETYQVGFSENIFTDKIIQYVFNEDIDISDLTDNLGRPLSQIFLTVIKTDSNNLFTSVSSGIETPFIDKLNTSDINTFLKSVPAINKIHNGGNLPFPSHTPLETNVKIINNNNILDNDYYYGDLVEYNKTTLDEVILSVVSHRFNTLNRETQSGLNYVSAQPTSPVNPPTYTQINLGPRQEGYFYQAHYPFKIREFSNYIEEGDDNTIGIPDYAVNMGDGRYLWRDLINIGFNETDEKPLNYPFLNGVHYLYQNECFYLRRQDQFGLWGLYYDSFPSDPFGKTITDKFIVKTANPDVC
jgi:hypothetical protein